MSARPYSTIALACGGVILAGLGLYFVSIRPPLLHGRLACFRSRQRGAALVATLAGATSVGWMAAVNFMIASDFKWVLLALVFPWILALVLYWSERPRSTVTV
jgi:hypothetical protein